ncbi:hypothetical protein BSLG_003385 [Batrachochytrium salamandrivorans]|nr:hypothetical protein BSLG_003385 [Batrachochytrium salamandrivorans]
MLEAHLELDEPKHEQHTYHPRKRALSPPKHDSETLTVPSEKPHSGHHAAHPSNASGNRLSVDTSHTSRPESSSSGVNNRVSSMSFQSQQDHAAYLMANPALYARGNGDAHASRSPYTLSPNGQTGHIKTSRDSSLRHAGSVHAESTAQPIVYRSVDSIMRETIASISCRSRLLSGYLIKHDPTGESTKTQRFFILTPENLHAFCSNNETETTLEFLEFGVGSMVNICDSGLFKGSFVLQVYSVANIRTSPGHAINGTQLTSAARSSSSEPSGRPVVWYLQCKDRADMLIWLRALRNVITRDKYSTAALPPVPTSGKISSAPTSPATLHPPTPTYVARTKSAAHVTYMPPSSRPLSSPPVSSWDEDTQCQVMSPGLGGRGFSQRVKHMYRTTQMQMSLASMPNLYEHSGQDDGIFSEEDPEFPIEAHFSHTSMAPLHGVVDLHSTNTAEAEDEGASKPALSPLVVAELRKSISSLKAADSMFLASLNDSHSSSGGSYSNSTRPPRQRVSSASSISSALAMLDAIEARGRVRKMSGMQK